MAASVVAAAIAVVGSIIAAWIVAVATRRATLGGIREQAEINRTRDEERSNEERRRLAFSIQAELIALRDRWSEIFKPLLVAYQAGQPAPYAAASFEYFAVFDSNTHRLGLFEPAHATMLVRLYVRLKGYLDSLKAFSEDERSKQSRQAPGATGQDVWTFIDDEVVRLLTEGQALMGPVAEAVAGLDVYLAAPEMPQAPKARSQTMRLLRRLGGVVTFITALAALLTAGNTWRQAKLLERSVGITQAAFDLNERAWVFGGVAGRPFVRTPEGTLAANIALQNSGKSPAFYVFHALECSLDAIPPNRVSGEARELLVPNSQTFKEASPNRLTCWNSREIVQRATREQRPIYMWLWIQYRDPYTRPDVLRFTLQCWKQHPPIGRAPTNSPVGQGPTELCPPGLQKFI